MKRLITFGNGFQFVGDTSQDAPPSPGDMPKMPQPVRRIKSERMANFRPMREAGNGYRPGPFTDLALDQCKFTVRDKIMCGAKTEQGSWCGHHRAVVYDRFREAAE